MKKNTRSPATTPPCFLYFNGLKICWKNGIGKKLQEKS